MKEQVQLLEEYFRDLREVRLSGAGVKEESYYDALSNLFNGLGRNLRPRVRCILQLANRGAGRPDGGLFTEDQLKQADEQKPLLGQIPARGAIEVKPTSDDAWITAEGDQVTDYWQLYRQVLVTNYRDFVLVAQDQRGNPVKMESYRLAESEPAFWAQIAHPRAFAGQHAYTFTEFLERVLLHAAPLTSPKDVAWFLASYARTARARIEGQDLPALASVRSALEEALGLKFIGDKGEHFFRSTFVQTLFYGIFSAWVLWSKSHPPTSNEMFRWQDTAWYLRVPIVQKLFHMMADPGALQSLELVEILEWTASVLNRVDRADFFAAFEEGRAVQYFYEPFLEAFDHELRKELGVWYTPPEIVQYMVARADRVLREELGLPDGLADPKVYVLDPCCGTGSYLVEVLRSIHATLLNKQADALVSADVKRAAIERVFGFEILPAPFVVAHLQLGLFLQTLGVPLSEDKHERVGVYLTNALTGWEPLDPEKEKAFQSMLTGFPELLEERNSACEVKREKPILVILGNPPYNAFAGTSPTEEQGLVEPYKAGLVKEWGIKKFNLDDLYVRFFRLAERRIAEQTGRGVVCYISNFSYLTDPSFVVMRQRFLTEFDRLWLDNMNGDSRETGKRTPDGKPDPSVFSTEYNREGIRVGTAVGLLVRRGQPTETPQVRYREFWGVTKRVDLIASLEAVDFHASYRLADPTPDNRYSFRPAKVSHGYRGWPRLVDLCGVQPYNGPIERRGNSLILFPHETDRFGVLKKYLDPEVDNDTIRVLEPRFMKSSGEFDADKARGALKGKVPYQPSNIVRYPFKPFDVRVAYLDAGIAPLFSRPSPQLLEHRVATGNAFFITRDTADKEQEGTPFYFSRLICDYDCISGHARHIPLLIHTMPSTKGKPPEEQTHFLDKAEEQLGDVIANLSPAARQYFAFLGISNPDTDARTAGLVWMHALAIGFSPGYLVENRDGIRQDWPRIPLPNGKEALDYSAELGERIAELLDMERDVPGVTAGRVRPELRGIAAVTRHGGGQLQPAELALTAGWGYRGQNDVVMPGKGKVIERDYTPEERQAITEGAQILALSLEEVYARVGERTCDVYLNDVAYWRNIPTRVWDYIIGGYQVIKKWLSYREYGVLYQPLSAQEVREVTEIARRIAAILLLQPALDENYQRCKGDTFPWGK